MSNVQERAEAYAKGEMRRIDGLMLAVTDASLDDLFSTRLLTEAERSIVSAFVIGFAAGEERARGKR